MKVWEIIEAFNRQYENDIDDSFKSRWLFQLDESFFRELADTHENPPARESADPFDADRTLFAADEFSELYLHWLRCKAFLFRGEIELYNNFLSAFTTAKEEFEREYHRTHMPKGTSIKNFTGW